MISWSPLWAMVLRHLRLYRRDPNLLLAALYWPLLDVLIWGFLGSWMQRSGAVQFKNYETVALLGILLWQGVGRGSNAIIFSFQEELWSFNLVNLFSLPLRLFEWICGSICFYVITVLMMAACSILLMSSLYDVSLWYVLYIFIIFLPPLLFSGIWLGFMGLVIIVLLGKRGIELSFIASWFLLPFSGAYYPIEVLPRWGQMISSWLPMSPVFRGMRDYLMYQHNPMFYVIKGCILGMLYALVAIILFVYFFNRSKQKGLARLMD